MRQPNVFFSIRGFSESKMNKFYSRQMQKDRTNFALTIRMSIQKNMLTEKFIVFVSMLKMTCDNVKL